MTCEYFGKCASCKLYELSYEEQLRQKTEKIKEQFSQFFTSDFEIFASQTKRFRNRAEFGIFHHDDNSFSYVMRDFDKGRVFIDSCQIVDDFIFGSMKMLREDISKSQILKQKLFGVEFLSSGDGEVLATLIYHKKLDLRWIDAANDLVQNSSIKIIGRSRGQRVVMDSDFVTIKSEIDDKVYKMRQVEGAFSQPNLGVNAKMLNWARANLANIGGDMLELYCGSGNFTIVNSELFEKVLATEVASSLIDIAKINAEQNNITNLSFVRLSAAETAEAMSGVREFNRLRGIDLNSYNCSTIFVDPPRAGLDEHSLKLAQDFDNICYISCSPTSLHRDMMELVKTHTPVSFAMFDQFAYTNHIECGVTFKKNKVR